MNYLSVMPIKTIKTLRGAAVCTDRTMLVRRGCVLMRANIVCRASAFGRWLLIRRIRILCLLGRIPAEFTSFHAAQSLPQTSAVKILEQLGNVKHQPSP